MAGSSISGARQSAGHARQDRARERFLGSTRRHEYGFRLGNVGVMMPWGITKGVTLDRLRLGSRTLEQLYAGLKSIDFFAPDISQRLTYFIELGSRLSHSIKVSTPGLRRRK
jgi:hypothetical protein